MLEALSTFFACLAFAIPACAYVYARNKQVDKDQDRTRWAERREKRAAR